MQNFNSTVGFHSNRQSDGTAVLPQKQQQQQQQQRFNQKRHFGVAKQVYNASTGSLGNGPQHPPLQAAGRAQHRGGSLSETMRIFERSQQQHLQHRKQTQTLKEVVVATPSTGALPPLETTARRSNASSGQKPADAAVNEHTAPAAKPAGLDANQNYLPIITTSRSDGGGKLTGRQQQSLTAAVAAAAATPAATASPDAKSETGAEPPTVRPGQPKAQQQQQHLPPPPHPPLALLPSSHVEQQQLKQQQQKQQQQQQKQQQQQQKQQTNRKSATNRRRRIKGVSGAGGDGKKGGAAAAITAKRIPIVYFSQENGSVHSGRLEDVDARSCDMRDPNATIAYGNVLEYIRDNQLMSSRKAKLICAWIRDLDAASSAGLFVYDPNLRWYSLPGELVDSSGDV